MLKVEKGIVRPNCRGERGGKRRGKEDKRTWKLCFVKGENRPRDVRAVHSNGVLCPEFRNLLVRASGNVRVFFVELFLERRERAQVPIDSLQACSESPHAVASSKASSSVASSAIRAVGATTAAGEGRGRKRRPATARARSAVIVASATIRRARRVRVAVSVGVTARITTRGPVGRRHCGFEALKEREKNGTNAAHHRPTVFSFRLAATRFQNLICVNTGCFAIVKADLEACDRNSFSFSATSEQISGYRACLRPKQWRNACQPSLRRKRISACTDLQEAKPSAQTYHSTSFPEMLNLLFCDLAVALEVRLRARISPKRTAEWIAPDEKKRPDRSLRGLSITQSHKKWDTYEREKMDSEGYLAARRR